ncbi:AMP-binding protein [Singulisphaera sp. PoT]|uniref:AMP-binding protein n=1 Tax=Singulisphaera sp. PoT TaxID=3411797 RepID=UPI003BF4E0A4
MLILPNHSGYIDPILILAYFYEKFRPRPLLYEENFRNPLLRPLVGLVRGLPIPELERPSQEALRRTECAVNEVIEGLRRGENFVLWPSGRVQRDGVERLGAARALTDILKSVPEANLVLVRTRGVWGSSFSYAKTGRSPGLGRNFRNGFLWLVANLFILMPRRRVDIIVEPIDRGDLPELERGSVNRWFEARYNVEGPELPSYAPYHFLFGPRSYAFPPSPSTAAREINSDQVKSETREAVEEMLADLLGRPLTGDERRPATSLDDLGLDSVQRMELALAVEQRFGFSADPMPSTIGEVLQLAQGLIEPLPSNPAPLEWFRVPSDERPPRILGETIAEAFLARALADRHDVAAADDLSGVVSYERLLVGAIVMARRFERLPTQNVGILFPASVACDTMLIGLYLAGKLPVLLNWTTGPANLNHAVRLTGITDVITSRRLRDRIGLAIDGVRLLDVEDLSGQVGWLERIRTLMEVRLLPSRIRGRVPRPQPDAPAAILFTSGSEKAPKAVPLTHRNIIADHRGALAQLQPTRSDSLLGFLPMFHSFGFTVTGLLPLLGGIRVVHRPDPTASAALARKVGTYRPSFVIGTSTFIEHLFDRARPGELDSLRVVLVGAEKCPPALFEKARRVVPKAHLLEGYGVTECSPVVAVSRPGANRPGTVGQPMPGVEVCVVALDTGDPLSAGAMGMLLVSGPTVFPGYLGDESSPFVERQGKRWYVTGDLASIDPDGFIRFRGRLKRFLKSGGEMISLPALEEPFALQYPPDENGHRVAVEGIETEDGRKIVLFTTESITLKEANARLMDAGLRGVMRLDEVRRVEGIPVLGSGKIDYHRLRDMIEDPTHARMPSVRVAMHGACQPVADIKPDHEDCIKETEVDVCVGDNPGEANKSG